MRYLLALILLIAVIAPAEARTLTAFVDNSGSRAVEISVCPNELHSDHPDQIVLGVVFTNISDRTVAAIRFRFQLVSTFGDQLDSYNVEASGMYSPGTRIDLTQKYTGYNAHGVDVEADIHCSVDRVIFADGSQEQLSLDPNHGTRQDGVHTSGNNVPVRSPDISSAPPVALATTRPLDDHLWQAVGTALNPIVHGHPKYCTKNEDVFAWQSESCHYARILWSQNHNMTPPSRTNTSPTAKSQASVEQVPHSTPTSNANEGFIGAVLGPLTSDIGYYGYGVVIIRVLPGSAAEQGGLRAGDVIEQINAQAPLTTDDVVKIIRSTVPGRTVELQTWTKGVEKRVTLQVQARPTTASAASAISNSIAPSATPISQPNAPGPRPSPSVTICDPARLGDLRAQTTAAVPHAGHRTKDNQEQFVTITEAYRAALQCTAASKVDQDLFDTDLASVDFQEGVARARLGQFDVAAQLFDDSAVTTNRLLEEPSLSAPLRAELGQLKGFLNTWLENISRKYAPW